MQSKTTRGGQVRSILFTSLFLIGSISSVQAQDATRTGPPVIVVSGTSEVRTAPDEATVRIGIVRQASSAQIAQQQANVAAQEILSAVGRLGVPATQIQTSRLTLTPVYAPRRPDSSDPPRIVAYNAQNVVSIRLEDLGIVGPVIDAGLAAGANQLEGVQFGLRNQAAAREKALKDAVTEARRKAEAIASALNVTLVGVLEVSEGGVSVVPKAEYYALAQARDTSTPVSPGEVEIQATVSVRYQIANRP
jgi:uncharacterized protein YggE